jgi:hypothetical protein
MIFDDLENEILLGGENEEENPSNKFHIKQFYHPNLKNQRILSMSKSKKYIYLLTDKSELLLIDSVSFMPVREIYNIPPSESKVKFKENLTKIWSDSCGNHNIIRYRNGIYYFNTNFPQIRELKKFQDIEICSVDFDDNNNEPKMTKSFLATDYNNNIYECNITVGTQANKDFMLIDNIEKIIRVLVLDWEDVDQINEASNDEKYLVIPTSIKNERIYGIKFFKSSKKENDKGNNDKYLIIAVTKNRFYQFIGEGNNFKQIFAKYNFDSTLFFNSCKIFPNKSAKEPSSNYTSLNILYTEMIKFEDKKNEDKEIEDKNIEDKKEPTTEIIIQFGWKMDSGYCFGYIDQKQIPYEQKEFTVIPYIRTTNKGEKKDKDEPIDIIHTDYHIFMLYKDCITVINKINFCIIDTIYFEKPYDIFLYNEFSTNNKNILLSSEDGLYQISLKNENKDIWKYYLEIDAFNQALHFCDSEKRKKRINRILAEIKFEKEKNGKKAASLFANSDESFENVCMKYLMKNNYNGLNLYLQNYMKENLNTNNSKKKNKKKEKEEEKDIKKEKEKEKDAKKKKRKKKNRYS